MEEDNYFTHDFDYDVEEPMDFDEHPPATFNFPPRLDQRPTILPIPRLVAPAPALQAVPEILPETPYPPMVNNPQLVANAKMFALLRPYDPSKPELYFESAQIPYGPEGKPDLSSVEATNRWHVKRRIYVLQQLGLMAPPQVAPVPQVPPQGGVGGGYVPPPPMLPPPEDPLIKAARDFLVAHPYDPEKPEIYFDSSLIAMGPEGVRPRNPVLLKQWHVKRRNFVLKSLDMMMVTSLQEEQQIVKRTPSMFFYFLFS